MRCPVCKGVMQHIVTDLAGDNYYQCGSVLTSGSARVLPKGRVHWKTCEVICNEKGKQVTGMITAYLSDNKSHILSTL